MRRFLAALVITILAGSHQAATVLAQGYGDPYGPQRQPRFQRNYDYDRPYERRQRDWVTPEERDFSREQRRFRIYREYQGGPYRPY